MRERGGLCQLSGNQGRGALGLTVGFAEVAERVGGRVVESMQLGGRHVTPRDGSPRCSADEHAPRASRAVAAKVVRSFMVQARAGMPYYNQRIFN